MLKAPVVDRDTATSLTRLSWSVPNHRPACSALLLLLGMSSIRVCRSSSPAGVGRATPRPLSRVLFSRNWIPAVVVSRSTPSATCNCAGRYSGDAPEGCVSMNPVPTPVASPSPPSVPSKSSEYPPSTVGSTTRTSQSSGEYGEHGAAAAAGAITTAIGATTRAPMARATTDLDVRADMGAPRSDRRLEIPSRHRMCRRALRQRGDSGSSTVGVFQRVGRSVRSDAKAPRTATHRG